MIGQKEKKLSTEFMIRAHSLELMDRIQGDFSPVFYGVADRMRDDYERLDEEIRTGGLIRTSVGFYRAFTYDKPDDAQKDKLHRARVLLFSYEYENLIPEKDQKTGHWVLPDAERLYVVPEALPPPRRKDTMMAAKATLMRDAMSAHTRRLLMESTNRLNLYAVDLTASMPGRIKHRDKDGEIPRIVKLTNGEVAYGIFEEKSKKDGKVHYRVRLYSEKDLGSAEDIARFSSIGNGKSGGFGVPLTSHPLGDFVCYDDAYKFVMDDWSRLKRGASLDEQGRAYRIFAGLSALRKSEKWGSPLKTGWRYTRALTERVFLTKLHRVVIAAGVVGIAFGLTGMQTVFEGLTWGAVSTFALRAGATALPALTSVFRDMAVEEFILGLWNSNSKEEDRFNSKYAKLTRESFARKFMIKDKENLRRVLPKISPDIVPHLRPLSQNAAGMAHDDRQYTPHGEVHNPDYWMATVQNRLFSAVISPLNNHMLSAQVPNGLVGIFHVSANNQCTTSYLGFREDLIINNEIIIPPESLKRLRAGGVQKVVHKNGTPIPEVETISTEQFFREIHEKIERYSGDNERDRRQDLRHVYGLFSGASGVGDDDVAALSALDNEDNMREYKAMAGHFTAPMWSAEMWDERITP